MENILTARKTWELKMNGLGTQQISKKLSINAKQIEDIAAHTNPTHYVLVKRDMRSYYDDSLYYLKNISIQKKELVSINNSLKYKKTLFKDIFLGTIALFALIIMI